MRAHDASELAPRWLPAVRSTAAAEPAARPHARHHEAAAILFADIVGFTRICERLEPDAAFAVLHGFHERMAHTVAARGASICDAIGDGVMAVWSGPDGEENAAQAFRCAFVMLAAMNDWSGERGPAATPLKIGLGLHAGPVMIGRTGGPLQPKLSAFGDAVNVANRLERMTRGRGTDLIVSDVLFLAAAAALPREPRLARFQPAEEVRVAGRAAPIRIRIAAA